MSTPSASSVSSERSFRRKLTSETLKREVANRGIIQLNKRLTPCIRDPSHPRWSQTCRTLSGRFVTSLYIDTEPTDPYTLQRLPQPVRRSGPSPPRAARPVLDPSTRTDSRLRGR